MGSPGRHSLCSSLQVPSSRFLLPLPPSAHSPASRSEPLKFLVGGSTVPISLARLSLGPTPGQRWASLTTVYGERPELHWAHLLGAALEDRWARCPDPPGFASQSTPFFPKAARDGFFHSTLKNSDHTARPVYAAVPSTRENWRADRPDAPTSSSVKWGDLRAHRPRSL